MTQTAIYKSLSKNGASKMIKQNRPRARIRLAQQWFLTRVRLENVDKTNKQT
jgi:hypothetical protein